MELQRSKRGWKWLKMKKIERAMRLCNYCRAGMAVLPTLSIGDYVFCDGQCASARIKQLEAQAAYWEAEARGNASAELETYNAAMSGELHRYKTP